MPIKKQVKDGLHFRHLLNFAKNDLRNLKVGRGASMKKKMQYSFVDLNEKAMCSFIEEAIQSKLDSTKFVELDNDEKSNLERFYVHYNEKYTKLKQKTEHLAWDIHTYASDFTETYDEKTEELVRIVQAISRIKRSVMAPTFDRLGPQVIEASRSASQLLDLMYRKRVQSEEFHQIVAGLARWHVLDDLEKQLQPHEFASCFADFGTKTHAGHPMGNLYELADKERLRDTLEALYQEKYSMSLARGWTVSKDRTKQFLFAFVLSLYKHPHGKLYGKMTAFHRFIKDVCGYNFIKAAETYQKWYRDYQKFVRERTKRTANHPKNEPDKAYKAWIRKEQKFNSLEDLVVWIRERLPQYGIALA